MAAIPNRIVIGNDQDNPIVTFENPEIISVDSDTSVSLIGEELYINQFAATVDYYVWQPYVINPADAPGAEYGPYSGDVVTFRADNAGAVTEGEISIEAEQDLHGYSNPWPAGGGKNKFVIASATWGALSGVTYVYDASTNTLSKSGTSSGASGYNVATLTLPDGTYTISAKFEETGSATGIRLRKTDASANAVYIGADSPSATVSLNGEYYLRLSTEAGATGGTISEIQIELSATKTAYEPPQNICPISGFTESKVYVSPTQDAQDATVYTIDLDGTRYGGTLDVTAGKLTVDRAIINKPTITGLQSINAYGIANFSFTNNPYALNDSHKNLAICNCLACQTSLIGNTQTPGFLISNQSTSYIRISSEDASTVPEAQTWVNNNNFTMVYYLATPFEVYLTPTQIDTLVGLNNIWSDTGSISGLKAVVQASNYDAFVSSDWYILCSRKNYDIRLLPYGTKIVYYSGNNIAGVFYVKTVERVQREWYKISAVSAIGLLDKQYHRGGIYTGQYLQDVIEEILGNDYVYLIDGTVAVQRVYGWLPYDTKRANLYQLLLAYGVEIVLGDNGAMFFTFPEAEQPRQIPTDRVFQGGKVIYDEPASRIEVNEHSYHYDPSVDEVVLFDNSSDEAVTDAFVKFDEPIYPSSIYCSSGSLTISSATTNYAVVSGSGILSGIPYVHNVRLISQDNANAPVEKIVAVQDATVVSFINADNVLARLSEYYFNATRVEQDIKVETEKPGFLYTTQNPFGELITGYISRMSKSVTSFARAKCRFIQNYTPTGSGAAYTERVLIPLGSGASQTWTIPAAVFEKAIPQIRITLIGKGQDGEDGLDGEDGKESIDRAEDGGAGGLGGAGGIGGNILTVTILATGLTELTVSNSGTDSVLSSTYYNFSSADGAPNSFGYFDILTGDVLAQPGADGIAGGHGGHGDRYWHSGGGSESQATDGEDVVYNGVTYHGGEKTDRNITSGSAAFPNSSYSGNLTLYSGGGGGGGAAVGNDGEDSFKPNGNPRGYWWNYNSGGDGADAVDADPPSAGYGNGGNGGHGGGGGGAPGNYESWNHVYSSVIATGSHYIGEGGEGSKGSAGNYGCAIIYF